MLEGKDQERLQMTLAGFAMNGDTAVIYYNTHRTRRSDGTPADDRFEVTHNWVREDGVWKVFGGMARAMTPRPAAAGQTGRAAAARAGPDAATARLCRADRRPTPRVPRRHSR